MQKVGPEKEWDLDRGVWNKRPCTSRAPAEQRGQCGMWVNVCVERWGIADTE